MQRLISLLSGGWGIHNGTGTVLLQNTIVAYNGGNNCNTGLTSNGHNLEDGTSCGLTATGDISDTTSTILDPLTHDSGTWVHPLVAGSPAIHGGTCLPGVTTVDQRGVTRAGPCDIGAYEWVWPHKVYLPLVLKNH